MTATTRRRERPTVHSPLLTDLAHAAARDGGRAAAQRFWRQARATGTPLVEPDPEDPAYRLVTFVWHDQPERPAADVLAIVHTLTDRARYAGDLTPHRMTRVPGTDVWAITHRLRSDHRASYQFCVLPADEGDADGASAWGTDRPGWRAVLDAAEPDPYNPGPRLPEPAGRAPSSVFALPDAPPQPYVTPPRDLPGRTDPFTTEAQGRTVTVHLPPGHQADRPHALAVLLDGEVWSERLRIADTLDALHAADAIRPTVTILVHTPYPDRMTDLSCSEEFTDWLADRLVPWAARYTGPRGGADDPAATVLAGQSAGGLTAAYAALRRPDRFGNVLSQSGSYWWPDEDDGPGEWLTRQYAAAPRVPVRFYLEAGLQEWLLLESNRRFRNVLRARRYPLTYREYNGGHDYACWRGGLATGLTTLLPPTGRTHRPVPTPAQATPSPV